MAKRSVASRVGAFGLAAALAVGLAACSPEPQPTRTPNKAPTTASPAPTNTAPVVPTLAPESTPEQAREVFDYVNGATLSANPAATGPDFVSGLVTAGFDRAAIEITADKTSIGLEPGSIQFAVRWNDSCILGQNGAGSGGYHSSLVPVLATGKCLIGQTVPLG